jgi:hypothetical protein
MSSAVSEWLSRPASSPMTSVSRCRGTPYGESSLAEHFFPQDVHWSTLQLITLHMRRLTTDHHQLVNKSVCFVILPLIRAGFSVCSSWGFCQQDGEATRQAGPSRHEAMDYQPRNQVEGPSVEGVCRAACGDHLRPEVRFLRVADGALGGGSTVGP